MGGDGARVGALGREGCSEDRAVRLGKRQSLQALRVVGRQAGEAQRGRSGGVPRARRLSGGALRGMQQPRAGRSVPRSRSGAEARGSRSEEHTSELQSQSNLVCRLLLEKKK